VQLSKKAAKIAVFNHNLAEKDMLDRQEGRNLSWDDRIDELKMIILGHPENNRSTYNYTIAFSNKEIIHFIKLAVEKAASDRPEKALGMGAITIIEELLKPQK